MHHRHVMPFGADLRADATHFSLWAPSARSVSLCVEGRAPISLDADREGWCRMQLEDCPAGTRYRYRIDDELDVPDPASRFQPDGVHGPSEVVDPTSFDWGDDGWLGRPWHETVLYELHVGTFSPTGDYQGLEQKLDHLVKLGVTAIQLMPLSATPGPRNWGYDGVAHFAPDCAYGSPNQLKSLIRAAHERGLMVFLDVVYNHFGPEGAYMHRYAEPMFSERHHTPWGRAINYDGAHSRRVRDFAIHNVLYWLKEYRFDGLRLDAVDRIVDDSEPHILVEIAERVHREVEDGRHVHLVLENDHNDPQLLERDDDGRPRLYTAQWNDDIHHALHAAVTGERGGYYRDFIDAPLKHLGRCLAQGFAYQGEPSVHRGGRRRGGPSAHLPPTAFIGFGQNHDQVGNRAFGERLDELCTLAARRAVTAIVLLAPHIPMLFMGEEWRASTPFLFFCDFERNLHDSVRDGRRDEFASFPAFADPEAREQIPDPLAEDTFRRSQLRWEELDRSEHADALTLHRQLLTLRHDEIAPILPTLASASCELDDAGVIHAGWRGPDAELRLTANLQPTPATPGQRPTGKLIWRSSAAAADAPLPPWEVVWTLVRR